MEKNEVYTHSAIISELLNPNGNHGQGDQFLKLFIDIINSKIEAEKGVNIEIPYLSASVSNKEYTIKEFLDKIPSGGRIDIYVTNKKQSIIIENKIDAESQENQLLRYYNYAINKYGRDFWLIYLQKTEDKHTDDDLDYSCGITKNLLNSIATKEKVIKITYEYEILQWLRECLKYTSNLPIIRETINQYIHLVNKITNRSNNHLMANEILNLIAKNSDFINAIESLYETAGSDYINLKKVLIDTLMIKLKAKATSHNLIFRQEGDFSKKNLGFCFLKDWKHCVCFEFSSNNYEDLKYGICLIDSEMVKDDKFNELVIKNFDDFKYDKSEYWVVINDYKEWNDIQWSEFVDDSAANKVFDCVIQIINKLEKIESLKI
ncbi:MAG: PD-(D/E)XK nuclease family protein [Sphingobacteriales bacterium]|nr:PD-(D/E)XK nuclease family protein [Sphingobacteriales bacterium]